MSYPQPFAAIVVSLSLPVVDQGEFLEVSVTVSCVPLGGSLLLAWYNVHLVADVHGRFTLSAPLRVDYVEQTISASKILLVLCGWAGLRRFLSNEEPDGSDNDSREDYQHDGNCSSDLLHSFPSFLIP